MVLRLSITSLLFTCITSNAQQDSIKREINKWSISISFSPDYSYRILKPVESNDTAYYAWPNYVTYGELFKQAADSLNIYEKGKYTYTTGITVQYRNGGNWRFEAGLLISDMGFQSNGFFTANGIYYGYDYHRFEEYTETTIMNLELPIMFHYAFGKDTAKNVLFRSFAGVMMALNYKSYTYHSRRFWALPSSNILEAKPLGGGEFSTFRIGYIAGAGVDFRFSKKLVMGVEPTFRIFPHAFFFPRKAYVFPFKEIPFSYGLNLRVLYTI